MKRDGFEAPASLSLSLEIKDIRKGVLFLSDLSEKYIDTVSE